MAAVTPAPAETHLEGDALVGFGRAQSRRQLLRSHSTVLVAALFLLVAVGVLLLPAHRPLSLVALSVSVVAYALAARVQFEFGVGYAIPTQGILVAMWFLLPPRMLPLAVCLAMLLSAAPDLVRRRVPLERLALVVAASWHAVGPAAVLYFATRSPRWSDVPLYLAAFAAQVVLDCAAGYAVTRPVMHLSPREHLRSVAPAYAVDALLAPLGLLVGFTAYAEPSALLLVLPVLLLFSTFAKERQHRIDNALELSTAYRGTAMLLGDVIEADDAYTGSHSRDVVDLVLAVADRLGLDGDARRRAEFAALLHDVGKVKIPTEIVNKPGPLDDDEWAVMKTHTILGEEMLERIGGLLGDVGRIVRSCHERWDGTGYPDGLAGAAIPLEARIVCACDAWSAMTTDRSYRPARAASEAAAELRRCAGTHFDPRVVDALLDALGA
ncbi:MAG TPA: HD-GYP domain-containing protein [Gaiellaceae bacterium]|nr:HD-GYP domain-containing protein [Gaiellaceae bacterium]